MRKRWIVIGGVVAVGAVGLLMRGGGGVEVDVSVEAPLARDWVGLYTSPIKDQSTCGGCSRFHLNPDSPRIH